jgi:hypothetical protein
MDSTEAMLPMKSDVKEVKDKTESSNSGGQKLKYNISSLADNIETTISTLEGLKLPLEDLLDVVSQAKNSLETFIHAIGVVQSVLRNTMTPPNFSKYRYDTLDTAFTEYDKKHPYFEWTGKLEADDWQFHDSLDVPPVRQEVIFGIAQVRDGEKPRLQRGVITLQPHHQQLQK